MGISVESFIDGLEITSYSLGVATGKGNIYAKALGEEINR